MTLKAAKDIFSKAMQVSRQRTLTATEKKLLVKSQAVIRSHTRVTAANPKRDRYAYKGYYLLLNPFENRWYISKDGYHIGSAKTNKEAEQIVDGLVNPKAVRTSHGTARAKGERGSDYGKPRQSIRGKRFEIGDRVRFKSDKSLGTVTRAGAHTLTVRDDNGDSWQVTSADIIHSAAVKVGRLPNNKKGVPIYGRCLRIEAIKMRPHRYGGKPTAAGQKYYHDFTSKNAKIYGLPNGDLLISTR